jgi:hypothetical protein
MEIKGKQTGFFSMDQSQEYKIWLTELKSKIRSSQIKAAMAVNAALIRFLLGFRTNDQ